MKITPVLNHGKPRFRVNVQRGSYRKRMFFATREEAVAFVQATGGTASFGQASPAPPAPAPRPRPVAVRRPQKPRPVASRPKTPKPPGLRGWLTGDGWEQDR